MKKSRIACLLFVATAAAQTDTVIRSETRVVLVDAVATDKKNKPVRDLTQKDFRIWEDGKEQKIASFSLETAGVLPERSSRHYIILFFDTSTLSPSTLLAAKKDATRFVDTFASPDRYIAVIAYGGSMQVLQNFTPDATRLDAALANLESFSVSPNGLATPAAGRARAAPANTPADPLTFRSMLTSMRSVAASVASVRDRKALVLFSGGFTGGSDVSTDVITTIDACNKANIAVYGVLGRGLIGRLDPPPSTPLPTLALGFQGRLAPAASAGGGLSNIDASGSQINLDAPNQDVVRALANGTGGLMLGTTNNLPEDLGNIAQEQEDYYLLGYTPAIESAEGTCHSLQVKVDRGLSVRARKGYCTEKPADPLLGKPAGKDLEARASGGTAGNIAVTAQLPWFYSGPNEARVDVAMDFVPRAVPFRKDKDGLHGEIDLAGIAYKPDGSVAARLSDTVKLTFATQQEADAFLKAPYHYTNQFEVVPGQYNFRIAVAPAGAQEFGKLDLPLAIDPWNGGNGATPSMSALALSHETHPVASQTDSDDLLLARVGPLVSNGIEVIPAGSNEFHVAERGFFYFELYTARPLPSLSVRVRILDRATGRQIDDSGLMNANTFLKPGETVVPVAMNLPIVSAGLPAGAYKIEVTAATVTRTADFDVK